MISPKLTPVGLSEEHSELYPSLSPSAKLEELTEAEDALSEANALNNYNAEVWAYLALVCLKVSVSYCPFTEPVQGAGEGPTKKRKNTRTEV